MVKIKNELLVISDFKESSVQRDEKKKKKILRLARGICHTTKGDVYMEAAPGKSGLMRERATVGECSRLQRTKSFTRKMEYDTKEKNVAVGVETRNA